MLPNHHSSLDSNLGTSVVPDLMRVYESLTQTSAPQIAQNTQISSTTQDEPYQSFQSKSHLPLQSGKHGSPNHNSGPTPVNSTWQHDRMPCQTYRGTYQDASNRNKQNVQNPMETQVIVSGLATLPRPSSRSFVTGAQRTSRKRSSSNSDGSNSYSHNKPSRKTKGGDRRWSKRFAWPDELHRDFVSAVFDVGLKHSSPSAILELMGGKNDEITSERIKSHLQKYRLHRQKSKKEFMGSYDTTFSNIKGGNMECDISSMNCGEVAAHLSYTTLTECETEGRNAHGYLVHGGALQLPYLSQAEKSSPIGASLGYLMGLFFSVKKQLVAERAANNTPPFDLSTSYQTSTPSQSQASACVKHPQDESQHEKISSHSETPITSNGQYQGCSFPVPTPTQYQTSAAMVNSFQAPTSATQQQHLPQSHFFDKQEQGYYPVTQQHCPELCENKESDICANEVISPVSSPMPLPQGRSSTSREENNMMKRDMKSQMAFQNKIRKLKEIELSKSRVLNGSRPQIESVYDDATESANENTIIKQLSTRSVQAGEISTAPNAKIEQENGREKRKQLCNGFEVEEDFWNADEDLFNFLVS